MNATAENLIPMIDADGDGLPDIETETDLDRVLRDIDTRTEALMADPSRRYSDLTEWSAIFELIEYAGRWFDADGNRIPVQPDPEGVVVNLSPTEVHPVEGEDPEFYDALGGLHVSRSRVNGCVIMANAWIVGHEWRDNFEAIAADLSCSARLIAMAGYHLIAASRWCLLPIVPLMSASGGWTPGQGRYWITDGGTPFNEEEIRMCVYNHSAAVMHGTILAGAGLGKAPFYLNPAQQRGEEHQDLLPGFATWTTGQRPENIIPRLIMRYNTPRFMRDAYRWAMNEAHAIDHGDGSPVPGYITPQEAGGEHSQAWYDAHENGDILALPRFSRQGLLR